MPSAAWPVPEEFDRRFCRLVRKQWAIHPYRVIERAGCTRQQFMGWERGEWRDEPLGFRMMIYAALRQLVCEAAMRTVLLLSDVEPFAQRRLDYDRVVRSIVGPGRRHPRDPRLPKPPVPASPAALGWLPI